LDRDKVPGCVAASNIFGIVEVHVPNLGKILDVSAL